MPTLVADIVLLILALALAVVGTERVLSIYAGAIAEESIGSAKHSSPPHTKELWAIV